MTEPEKELEDLHGELVSELSENWRVLSLMRAYWLKRAEVASRSATRIVDADPTNMVKGQLSICYETADELGRALEKLKAAATAGGGDGTSPKDSYVV